MSRKLVSIEVDIDEWKAHEVVMNELLWERSILKKHANHIANKKETLLAIEAVLDYFSSDWRETTKS